MPSRYLIAMLLLLGSFAPAVAQTSPTPPPAATPSGPRVELPQEVRSSLASIVRVSARIPPRARSAATLGAEREGHGVVIDDDGLILTIGYLVLEADEVVVTWGEGRKLPATVVAYDYDSGFGLVRTAIPLKVPALKFADSDPLAVKDEVWIAGHGGERAAARALVTARREFAGYWEYLLENAVFTTPPYALFGGAALLSGTGELLGIGALFVQDALRNGNTVVPGNMFVPINRLKPILADMIQKGRSAGNSKPWLGLYLVENLGRVAVANVVDSGPAASAGMKRGDIMASLAGLPVTDIADFYRRLWALGDAGTEVRLQVERSTVMRDITVKSGDRYKFLRLDSSL